MVGKDPGVLRVLAVYPPIAFATFGSRGEPDLLAQFDVPDRRDPTGEHPGGEPTRLGDEDPARKPVEQRGWQRGALPRPRRRHHDRSATRVDHRGDARCGIDRRQRLL